MPSKKVLCSIISIAIMAITIQLVPERANAQLGSLLGGLFGGVGGGQTVRIVDDVSPNTIMNTIKTGLIEAANAFMSGQISSLNLKETVLDPIAWNMAKQMQQQMTGELMKWLGGQLPGQNGKVPFVQDYSRNDQDILAAIMGNYLTEGAASGDNASCSQERSFRLRTAVLNAYREDVASAETGTALSCPSETANTNSNAAYSSTAHKIMGDFLECRDETCAFFDARIESYTRALNAQKAEREIRSYSQGMIPQRVCRVVNDPDGRPRQLCELVTPPHVAAEAVTQQLVRVPSDQLLHMDEFNEIVSNFMSFLPNQLIQGFGGILSMVGDPNFVNNIFGPDGNLSYVDALVQDNIASYQSGGVNPIKDAIDAEQKYASLQRQVTTDVNNLDNQLSTAKVANQCTSLELTEELKKARSDASSNLLVSSSTMATLISLDQQYTAAEDSSVRNAIVSAFMGAKNQGAFRDQYQNQQLESTYINYTFALAVNQFQCEIVQCGGAPASSCILAAPTS